MTITIHLLGRPRIERSSGEVYEFRSRKSWAVLAYLLLSERPPGRAKLASLLFSEADDPLRALRWNLSEIRRSLGEEASIDGDPLVISLEKDVIVDVDLVANGSWADAIDLPGLGLNLLEGINIQGASTFETWLISEQCHIAAASEAILHEAALGSMSQGSLDTALGYAIRAAEMSPLDENHHALLIRLYRLGGDDKAAESQFELCTNLFKSELGVKPGAAVNAAMRETQHLLQSVANEPTIAALIEAGSTAVSAGAIEAGIHSLRTAIKLADGSTPSTLRFQARLALAETLIHSIRGLDEEGLAMLVEADSIASDIGDSISMAQARAEMGYVDFLRARYDRATRWLSDAFELGAESPAVQAKAATYLGSVESDRANYPQAIDHVERAIELSQAAEEPKLEAYGLTMLGRISYLRGDLDNAAKQLDDSIELAENVHWLSFLPWPQCVRGEVQLAREDTAGAYELLEQAFARACQLGDPCWEGYSVRGLAMIAAANGETDQAFKLLADARTRTNRLADPYVWLDAYILDAQCALGVKHGHSDTGSFIGSMRELSSRTGMKELTVRSLLHGAALGSDSDYETAVLMASDVENPALHRLLARGAR